MAEWLREKVMVLRLFITEWLRDKVMLLRLATVRYVLNRKEQESVAFVKEEFLH